MKCKYFGLFLGSLATFTLFAPCALHAQDSSGYYRIPYNNGTKVKVTRDHASHAPVENRIDMVGKDGGGEYAIVAAADGVIRMIEDSFDKRQNSSEVSQCNNNYVWIEHDNGEWTKYSHMKKGSTTGPGSFGANLKVGDRVKAGDFLGWESNVGCASGDHLHFEVAKIASTAEINSVGGFVDSSSKNRIPRVCAVPGWKYRDGRTYTAVGFGLPIYRDKDYKGAARAFIGTVKNYPDLHGLGFGDNVSSILTPCPDKLYAIFYEHKNYGGRALYFDGFGSFDDTGRFGFNDNISSMKLFTKPRTGISVFEHDKYRGKSTFLSGSIADLNALGLNDRISSIKTHGQVKVQVYEHKNFQGKSRTVTKWTQNTKSIDMNDNISSIKFIPPPFRVTKASLKFKVHKSNVCKKKITIETEFETNQAGTVVYRRERQGGSPSGWVSLKSKKVGSKFIAKKTETQWVTDLDQMRRVKVKDSPIVSAWEHYKVKCPPFKITDVSYSFRAEPGYKCPREITVLETYKANGPGQFLRRRERQGGPPSEWIKTDVKLQRTTYSATFQTKQNVGEISQTRRVVARSVTGKNRPAKYFKKSSKWVKMQVKCLDIKQSAIIFDGKDTGTCKFKTKVKLRVNADMQADLPYQFDCADGQSKKGTFSIKKTGKNTFIGVDTVKLNVTKTGKQACALKADLGKGLKTLTFQGKDFTCKEVLDAAIYIDGPAKGKCPTDLPVRVRVNARDRHAVGFNLKCTTGENWNGKLKVKKTGPNTFIGVMTKKIKVKKSGKIACALRSTLTGKSKVIALRGKDYQCASRVIPTPPGKITTGDQPIKKVRCIGGKPKGKSCRCPKGAKLRKLKVNTYRCFCPSGTKLLRGICAKPAA